MGYHMSRLVAKYGYIREKRVPTVVGLAPPNGDSHKTYFSALLSSAFTAYVALIASERTPIALDVTTEHRAQ